MNQEYHGIFVALTTPFDNEAISIEKLRENLDKYNRYDSAGYLIGGSTGEGPFLSDSECLALTRTARSCVKDGRRIITGTARASMQATLTLTKAAADEGADAALVLLPHYYKSKMTTEALITYFLHIAEKSPIPIILYSIPQNTGIQPAPELFIELSRHSNIVGVKDSSGSLSFFENVFPRMNSGSVYLLGAGSLVFPGMMMGASGGILTLAAVAPELCAKLYHLYRRKQWEEACNLQQKLVPLNQAVTQIHGIPAAKYALDLQGYHGGSCRLPLLPLSPDVKVRMKAILGELDLIDINAGN